MAAPLSPGETRFLEKFQNFEKKYDGDPKGFRRGLMLLLRTAQHFDPEREIAACLADKDWERLNDLFFQLTRLGLLPGATTGYDHSGRLWSMLDLAACQGPEAVRRYLPPELGPAKNGIAMYVHGMNLLLCLLYCKGKKQIYDVGRALEDAERFTQTKRPLWERGVVQFLICLYEDRPAGMRNALRDVCTGYGQLTLPRYKKIQCLNAYGLMVLARAFAPEEVFREVRIEEGKNFSLGYLNWRLSQGELTPRLYLPYPDPAGAANLLLLAEPGPERVAQLKLGDKRYSPRDQKNWYEDDRRMVEELLAKL